jgi:hypothetical protein
MLKKKLKNFAATIARKLGGSGYIRYPDLNLLCTSLSSEDGKHLSPIANDIFLNTV